MATGCFTGLQEKKAAKRPPEVTKKTQSDQDQGSIIGEVQVSEKAVQALAKGPKFGTTSNISDDQLLKTAQAEVAALAYALLWKAATSSNGTTSTIKTASTSEAADRDLNTGSSTVPPNPTSDTDNTGGASKLDGTTNRHSTKVINIAKSCPFKARRTAPPRADPFTESAIKGFQLDVERIIARARTDVQPNITPAERSSIRERASTKNVPVTRSDKGGEIAIMPTSTLHKINMEHLN